MPSHSPLEYLEGLEDREKVLQRRLTQVYRKIPKTSSPVTVSLSGPVSLKIEAHHLGGQFEKAAMVAQQAVETDSSPDAWIAFAKALVCIHQIDDARQALRQAKYRYNRTRQSLSPEFLYLRALLTRNDQAALETALAACEADRSYPEALFLTSRLAIKLGYSVGQKILDKIKPLMVGSVQRKLYEKMTQPVVPVTSN